ncbi:MAG: type III-A CRISPR-associated RAMP protein Csm4 [candidate division KSB1 bacterium]|nr:type III-A CRISPR-associated RAMP protein Csm4 [candidate division KSB1 bacterium]
MPLLFSYFLHFRSPLHIGERGVGLEETRTHVPADTLFSALCSLWRELYGVEALYADVLDWFTEEEGGNEPFFLSSAFPFAGTVRFLPRPLARLNVEVAAGDDKAFKRVRFVSEAVFTALVSGGKPTFTEADCINGGSLWVTGAERAQLADWRDEEADDIVLWRQDTVPRVTLDRITSASAIWHLGQVQFSAGAGLWFAVAFNEDHGEALRHRFAACLRALGDTGLGGERSAGRGLFRCELGNAPALPESVEAERFVTLAPVCPKDTAQLTALIGAEAAYDLLPRRGWVTSPEAGNLRRNMVWMFAEGSVLTGNPQLRTGRLVDVRPDACPHPVWRYGYAFPVGVTAP